MQKIAIIIPCYNEEKRLNESLLEELLNSIDADIYLVNDGSRDNTELLIEAFAQKNPERCFVINYKKNSGKAGAIFKAVNELMQTKFYDIIGYFDADFSTPVLEIKRLVDEIASSESKFILGSRILLLNSGIKRKLYRHFIGRLIITLINMRFKLGIYDTQCGAKLFRSEIVQEAFKTEFKTSWLFDVEIFIRLKNADLLKMGKEVPIYNWRDVDGSKLGWKTGFKIIKELSLLFKNY